jgi:hypothetical protein
MQCVTPKELFQVWYTRQNERLFLYSTLIVSYVYASGCACVGSIPIVNESWGKYDNTYINQLDLSAGSVDALACLSALTYPTVLVHE